LFDRVLGEKGIAVLNMDDPFGATMRLIAQGRKQEVITVGALECCDLRILNTRYDGDGQELRFSWRGDVHGVRLGLIGSFQASNALMAAGLAIACGEDPDAVFNTLSGLETVRGRMQLAATRNNGAKVFVDYSHTPDSLKTALQALRPHTLGRLIVVFGAGGDRDKGKRPFMGKAAAEFADVVFVTDDNPRSEDPAVIRAEVMAGCPDASNVGDRAEAILRGVDALQPGDTLLIAGKGHETGQEIGDDILAFDDVEQASISVATLEELGA
ncbi:MAG: UDP-N-acetylmuramoyl-L-alanyl-D-glutamate--2,6-diaminopimelate ligase, partial [Rhodobacteraceae bacterium]|nr:UDP-N-acetylmuramoyl-L-alanyl-D-glutamate--2,6-diaminopimelate ligase [Paracoccaceae bacterium]